jgi:hypothetical protein
MILSRVIPWVPVRDLACDVTVSRGSGGHNMRGSMVPIGEVTRVAAVSRVSGGSSTRGNL